MESEQTSQHLCRFANAIRRFAVVRHGKSPATHVRATRLKLRTIVAAAVLLLFAPASASNFVTVKLPRGVEVEVPKGWWLLTAELNQLISTSAEAAMDLTGMGVVEESEVNLIAANSMPRTTYAAVRIDSTTPVSAPPSEVSNLTAAELKALEVEMHVGFQNLLPMQGNELLGFLGVRRTDISGHPALITDYRRSGPKGPVIVRIIQIFTPSQSLMVNLSYRESEQALWKPIIGKVFHSIVVRDWP